MGRFPYNMSFTFQKSMEKQKNSFELIKKAGSLNIHLPIIFIYISVISWFSIDNLY